MLNTKLLGLHNILVIALFTTVAHIVARPLYNAVARKDS